MAENTFSTLRTNIKSALSYIRDMAAAVKETDAAMTELYKATDETDKRYEQFLKDASKNAKDLGRSVSSLIAQTAEWSKLGFSLEQAEKLAKISSVYANISGANDASAVSDLATAMKAFNIEAENSITIIDSLNKLSRESSVSIDDLMAGLRISAESMSAAGSDINETLAMLAEGAKITGSAENFGNFLNIASLRIRGMKDELEALGEEVSASADSVNEVQSQVLKLTGGQVNIFDNSNNLRDYYEIMEDIAGVYSELSSSGQASLDEILFGKGNLSSGDALIQAFGSGQVQKALEASLSSSGSAMKEQERILESFTAKTTQLQAAFQSLSDTVLNSGLAKFFVDLGTGALSALDAIIDKIGVLSTIGIGAGLASGLRNTGKYLRVQGFQNHITVKLF